jgi:NAD(P)-dependent dehydrogenase (short-subunit alcohol dehydrogenase family)
VQRLIAFIGHHARHIKYVVNAAGYFKPTPFLDHTGEEYDTYLDLNRALFFISQAVAKNMAANGGGSIVHIGSMWAQQAIKATPSSAYSMAKAGLHALTQHMAMELAAHKIRVNAVSPAVVKTPIYGAFIDPPQIDATLASFDSFHPIGRIGTAADVARTIDLPAERRRAMGDRGYSGMWMAV